MRTIAQILVAIVALLHAYFLVLEMFLWATPFGAKTFKRPLAEMQAQKVLAANQGLYNGFLAAGLLWGLVSDQTDVQVFFLVCVIVAGAYGAATVNKRILVVQAAPALLALVAVLAAA